MQGHKRRKEEGGSEVGVKQEAESEGQEARAAGWQQRGEQACANNRQADTVCNVLLLLAAAGWLETEEGFARTCMVVNTTPLATHTQPHSTTAATPHT